MNIREKLPLDIINSVLNCRLHVLFTKYRIEPNENITIYRNPHTNKLEHLNASGTLLFELANTGLTIGDIIDGFIDRYHLVGSKDSVTKDVLMFIRSMERKGLVEILW